jgi:hypothetical protein
METVVITYLVYLALSIALTVWVAQTLHKNGRVFLLDVFAGRADLADSVNHLLVVGFYLVNLGFVSWTLKVGYSIPDARTSIEALSVKIGLVLLVLGLMHFFNLLVFSRMRSNARRRETRPRVGPAEVRPAGADWGSKA